MDLTQEGIWKRSKTLSISDGFIFVREITPRPIMIVIDREQITDDLDMSPACFGVASADIDEMLSESGISVDCIIVTISL